MLKIIKASDHIAVENIIGCIYGNPGTRKTSFAQTAEAPLLLDFDNGSHRAQIRKDTVRVATWGDVEAITAEEIKPFKTIIIDTIGRALDAMSTSIIAKDPKMSAGGGQLSLKGYGRLKSDFAAWLKFLRTFGADVIMVAHSDEKQEGENIIERIDAQGASKNEVYKQSDFMGRLVIREGKNLFLMSPSDTSFGKNPAQMPPIQVPAVLDQTTTTLGDVIHDIKKHMNRMSQEQAETSTELLAWKTRVDAATSGAKLTALIPETDALDERIKLNAKRYLNSFAKDHGFVYDGVKKTFVELGGQAKPEPAADEFEEAVPAEPGTEKPKGRKEGGK